MSKKIECRLSDDLYADLKEYASKEGVTVTDIVIAGINSRIYKLPGEVKKQPAITLPELEIIDSRAPGAVEKPVSTPDIIKPVPKTPGPGKALPNGYVPKSALELGEAYKISHPMDICNRCRQFNRNCVCGATIYEPDDIQPARKRKQSSNAAPVVQAMLSKIKRETTE